jgi:hypothetical protein
MANMVGIVEKLAAMGKARGLFSPWPDSLTNHSTVKPELMLRG